MDNLSVTGLRLDHLPAGLLLAAVLHVGMAGAQEATDAPAAAEPAPAAVPAVLESGPVAATVPPDLVELHLTPLTRAELEKEAADVRELARAKVVELVEAQVAARAADGGAANAARQEVERLLAERSELFARLKQVLQAWEGKGGDADAIAEYRQYMSAVTTEGAMTTDSVTMLTVATDWLISRDGGIALGLRIAGLVLAFLALLIVARFVAALVGRALHRAPQLSTLLKNFLAKAAFVATIVVGLLVVLSMMGVHMGPAFAVLGGASFIVAFAMQSTLSNFAAGLMIMIYKPFDVGNFVTVGGESGTVKEVSLVSTTLATPDNQVITVPNSSVWGSVIRNVTVNDTRRVDLVFGIAYDDDAQQAARVMEEVVKAHPLVLDDPQPVIRMHELADSSVNFVCRPWTKTGDYWTVYWDLTQQVKLRFDAEGISIPFPQRDVHLYSHAAGQAA